ncbi:MAG: hypothetical protein H0W62_08790 [Chitinophagales bacterium]|nr:hypothetical protein [Chitinophagales bacterium]
MKILLLVFYFFSVHVLAQDSSQLRQKAGTLFIEGLGLGTRISLNGDFTLKLPVKKIFLSFESGISFGTGHQHFDFLLFRENLLYGTHKFFAELGINYLGGLLWYYDQGMIDHYTSIHFEHFFIGSIGGRYQDIEHGGLFVKLDMYPVKGINNTYSSLLPVEKLELYKKKIVPWIGASVGYTFKPEQKKKARRAAF